MKLDENMLVERYGLQVRLAREDDAEFILSLRTDPRLGRHISATAPDIDRQRIWLRDYKLREAEGREFYFIISLEGRPIGTFRLYNIDGDRFESGSWVFDPQSPPGASILGDIICKEIAYDTLGLLHDRGDVRRDNRQVMRYNLSWEPTITGEDEQNVYMEFTKENFNRIKPKHIALCTRVMRATLNNERK